MNTVKWLVAVGLTVTFISSVSEAFTVDGTLDPGYGSAIATQVLGSTGQDNYLGDTNQSAGSELDAAYAVITNGVLYLFLAGNLDSGALGCNNGCVANDKLNVFFMTDSGAGGDHTLGTNYNHAADSGNINRMGVAGWGHDISPPSAGLTFDSGFTANYWIGVTINPTNIPNTTQMSANYEVICPGCDGYFLGKATPPSGVLIPSGAARNPYGIQVALNNSNTNGVWGDINGCYVLNGCPTNCAQTVTTGVEMAIPLSAIGGPLSSVSICAFISDNLYATLYNQALGPVWDGTTDGSYCEFEFATDSSEVDFSSLPGTHYFTLSVPPCSSIQVSPADAGFPSGGGASNEAITVSSGGCTWTVTPSTNWITITSSPSGSGNGSFTYSVSTNTSINPRSATLTIAGQVSTQFVSIVQSGTVLPPLGSILIDGTKDPVYGCALSVQTIGTSFGTNSDPTAILAAGGSELDAAYGLIVDNVLYLFLAGNLQDNGNRLHVFFMTGPGGTNTLVSGQATNIDTSAGRSVLNWMGPTNSIGVLGPGPGLTFDAGFAPNYWIDVIVPTPGTNVVFNFAQLWPGGTNASGLVTNAYFLGRNGGTNGTLVGGTNPFLIQATINNSNTGGVDWGNLQPAPPAGNGFRYGCYTNAEGVVGGETTQAVTVVTGVEMAIPLAAFGSPTGQVAVCAFIANNGAGLQLSNQILGPLWDGTPDFCATGPGKTTNTWAPYLNLGTLPGTHYFYVGPEMRITSVSVLNKTNVNVSFLTENNTNLTYQLQRTTVLTTNSVWSNVGGLVFGTTNGAPVTVTDPSGGTNKPGAFYRIRQAPNCLP